MGKPAVFGGIHFTDNEAKKLKSLARKGVGKDKRIEEKDDEIAALNKQLRGKNGEIADWQQSYNRVAAERDTWKANYERLWKEVKDFIDAIRSIPGRLLAFISEHLPQRHDREASR